jgi:hypothetical protein
MFLSALLLTAAVQAAPEPPAPPELLRPPGVVEGRIMPPARQTCDAMKSIPVDQSDESDARPLGQERPGHLQYAVMRSIGGCPVPTPIRQVRPAR